MTNFLKLSNLSRFITTFFVGVAAVLLILHTGALGELETTQRATVAIYAFDAPEPRPGGKASVGTGFFVDDSGTVATAYHVIAGAKRLEIFDYAKQKYVAPVVVRLDAGHDLALLRVPASNSAYLPLQEKLPGFMEQVLILGHPQGALNLGILGSVTQNRAVEASELLGVDNKPILREGAVSFRVLYITSTIYGGMSGGPILNSNNEVVAILSGSLNVGGTLAWGVPSSYLRKTTENLSINQSLADISQWPNLPYNAQLSRSLNTYVATVESSAFPKLGKSRFAKVDITEVANTNIDWLLTPPKGDVSFDGVPFTILSGNRAVLHTKNNDRPDFPAAFIVRINSKNVTSLHFLLNGNWVRPSQQVGAIKIVYSEGAPRQVDLTGMQTIRETWMSQSELFKARFVPPPSGVTWNTVFSDSQMRGAVPAIGFLDKLSVSTDPKRQIDEVVIFNNDWQSGTGIILTALTLESSE